MTKKKIEELMKRDAILRCELSEVFSFVESMLLAKKRELEDDEPYATSEIQRLEVAAREVYEIGQDVEEIMFD
jgi:hypothetical protein